MSDEDLAKLFKKYLLAMNRLQESISAVGLVLKERGVMPREVYEDALRRVQEMNRENREQMEKADAQDPSLELLRKFEGPIQ